eukprot:3940374-Rhodomonas_salina.1
MRATLAFVCVGARQAAVMKAAAAYMQGGAFMVVLYAVSFTCHDADNYLLKKCDVSSKTSMNGSFQQAFPRPANPVELPVLASAEGEAAGVDTRRRQGETEEVHRARLVRESVTKVKENYMMYARPRDLRYAHKVHGAALAPPWDSIWLDDTTISTDVHANLMENQIRQAITAAIVRDIEFATGARAKVHMVHEQGGSVMQRQYVQQEHTELTPEFVHELRSRFEDMIPRDKATSRLSNLVLDLEEVAVNKMRNIIEQQIKRNVRNVHLFYEARHQLDLTNYENSIAILCRSMRRDDLLFSSFGHLVGCLLVEALFTKGTHAVGYMQLRMQRARIDEALKEAVAFLLRLGRRIKLDKVGQPEHETLYEYMGKPLLLVSGDEARVAVLKEGTGLKRGTRLVIGGGGASGASSGSSSGAGSPASGSGQQ